MELVSGDNWTTGAIGPAKLQSNHHHQQTNIQFFYRPDALPVAQPTVLKHWRENITFHGLRLAYLKLTWGLQTLFLTTNSSWLRYVQNRFYAIGSVYGITTISASVGQIKSAVWAKFTETESFDMFVLVSKFSFSVKSLSICLHALVLS